MKICALSDTHNRHNKLEIPECDLLIHAGDWTSMGYKHEVQAFAKWIDKQPAKHIVLIPGNHELQFEKDLPASKLWFTEECPRAHLLIDEGCEIEGLKIWGSPVQPEFFDWAWNRDAHSIQKHWNAIPEGTDILITHGPPWGILDQTTYANGDIKPGHLGCILLMERIKELKPSLHFFGHIHHPGGNEVHAFGTSFYNAAICDECYYPGNPITIVEFDKTRD